MRAYLANPTRHRAPGRRTDAPLAKAAVDGTARVNLLEELAVSAARQSSAGFFGGSPGLLLIAGRFFYGPAGGRP